MKRLFLLAALTSSCAPTATTVQPAPLTLPGTASPKTAVAVPPAEPTPPASPGPSDAAPVRRQLKAESVANLVALGPNAMLFRSKAAARAAGTSNQARTLREERVMRYGARADGSRVRYARVISDDGEVVEVEWNRLKLPSPLPRYDLKLFVLRRALVPVLKESVTAAFDDGTGVTLMPGMPITMTSPLVPSGVLSNLPVAIRPEQVGLSFELEDSAKRLPPLNGDPMGCGWTRGKRTSQFDLPSPGKTRVDSLDALRADEEAELRKKHPKDDDVLGLLPLMSGSTSFQCALKDQHAPLAMNGATVDQPFSGDQCKDYVSVTEARGKLYAVLRFPRALVRFATTADQLTRGGKCAIAGGRYRNRPMIWAPKRKLGREKATVYWEDGTEAGHQVAAVYKLQGAKEHGAMVCFQPPRLAEPLCFQREDVKHVKDH